MTTPRFGVYIICLVICFYTFKVMGQACYNTVPPVEKDLTCGNPSGVVSVRIHKPNSLTKCDLPPPSGNVPKVPEKKCVDTCGTRSGKNINSCFAYDPITGAITNLTTGLPLVYDLRRFQRGREQKQCPLESSVNYFENFLNSPLPGTPGDGTLGGILSQLCPLKCDQQPPPPGQVIVKTPDGEKVPIDIGKIFEDKNLPSILDWIRKHFKTPEEQNAQICQLFNVEGSQQTKTINSLNPNSATAGPQGSYYGRPDTSCNLDNLNQGPVMNSLANPAVGENLPGMYGTLPACVAPSQPGFGAPIVPGTCTTVPTASISTSAPGVFPAAA